LAATIIAAWLAGLAGWLKARFIYWMSP
jgi:hypothetical protein